MFVNHLLLLQKNDSLIKFLTHKAFMIYHVFAWKSGTLSWKLLMLEL